MATVDLNSEDFVSTIKENDLVLVDFWADWCGPCKRFSPIYSKVSESHDDVVFGKVDTEANQELSGSLGIMSIPTVMAFHKGNMVFNQAGLLNASQLENLIEQLKGLPEETPAS
ncbi:thioredoxin [Enemella evansiae]|uniref:Thioredoxin n=1 Tax=Enemella evansiae TaxID=2016499 RepID=A0A255G6W3_9ACTN|nr:thioredoxin [Enemella evansiae]PFG66161.1 thioredoxin [Propionibacteriaceae bacterium ES.041]OYN94967.1 thioredoxin [Enemella evansiae]OYO04837.1 thioredoxin [Enemella evansiae]OYO06488.1 thioredoxin [Enemella evansiae]OYO07764.1 thioredoxin [Enemella evansiae]